MGDNLESSEGAAAHFREYMNNFEIDSLLRAEFEVAALATPMIYLPVTRSANAFQSSVQLWLSIRSFSLSVRLIMIVFDLNLLRSVL